MQATGQDEPRNRSIWRRLRGFAAAVQKRRVLNCVVAAVVVLAFSFTYQVFVEFVRTGSVSFTLNYLEARGIRLLPGYLALMVLMLSITVVSARPFVAHFLVCGACFAAAFANLFKLAYRAEPVVPKDLVQMGEAVGITGELQLTLTRELWLMLLFWLVGTLLLVPFRLPYRPGKKGWLVRGGVSLAGILLVPAVFLGVIGNRTLMRNTFKVYIHNATLAESYYRNSFVSSFVYLAAAGRQPAPQGYSAAAMQDTSALLPIGEEGTGRTLAAEDAAQPDIVIVLLESFWDITQIPGTSYAEDLTPNYTQRAAEGVSGNMYVDKRGGGTSGFEFAVLTGFSTDYMPVGSVPFIEYADKGFPSIVGYYADSGYSTVALHPYEREFYNRMTAYENLGFEVSIFEDEFGEEDVLGTYISNAALGRRMIEEYEARMESGAPVFMQAVTMQNHTPHTAGSYPEAHTVQASSGISAEYDACLSVYATGIRDDDALIGMLCDYFETVDRDVVLLFYGDHQSGIKPEDHGTDLLDLVDEYVNADAETQWLASLYTPYLMWANWQTVGEEGGNLAPYMLFGTMADVYGFDAPAWHLWLGEGRGILGGIVAERVLNPDGTISYDKTEEQAVWLQKYELMQYDAMFGKRYILEKMYG